MGYVESLLGKNERVVVKTRQHWMVLAKSFLGNFVFGLVVVIGAVALTVFGFPMGLALVVVVLLPGILFLRDYLVWWNEEYLVTTRRVMHSEGIINKHVIDSSLEKVNDVVLDQSYFGRLFDYGDIEILTGSEIGVNKLHLIAQPVKFKTEMLNQKEAMGHGEYSPAPIGDRPDDIPDLIAELDQLRQRGVLTEAEFQQKKAELLAKM